jgi:hypothetical protein
MTSWREATAARAGAAYGRDNNKKKGKEGMNKESGQKTERTSQRIR